MSANESAVSTSPATALNKAYQMEVDPRESPAREAQLSLPAQGAHELSSSSGRTSGPSNDHLDKELIPSTSRLSRLPSEVPSPNTLTSNPHPVAIPVHQNNLTTYTSQDVHLFVNNSASSTSSTVTRTSGQQSTPPETSVSSFSQPLHHHVLTHPIRRPRTSSTIFQSSTDLAAHYGIPQILPPAPRPTPRNTAPVYQQPSTDSMIKSYLNMLYNKPTETPEVAPSAPPMSASTSTSSTSAAGLDAPVEFITQDQLNDIAAIIGKDTASCYGITVTHLFGSVFAASSPEFRDQDTFDAFMSTSPLLPELDYGSSPSFDTPYNEFLTTPLFQDENVPVMDDFMNEPLFPMLEEPEVSIQSKAVETFVPTLQQELYSISPSATPITPALHSFDTFETVPIFEPSSVATTLPVTVPAQPPVAPSHPAPRRSKATGIRKGVTPDSLLDESAPTQPRKYTTPSATSRKELPAVFARKRSRSTAFGEEEDQLEEIPPDATEAQLIEIKRRQNTVAARRSRKRKLEQFQKLENSRNEERRLKEQWKERANVLLGMLRSKGVKHPDFPEDVLEYADA
ncbi:hypothetical protein JR316_0007425 [Psilocybe cubensis]|uniref:BZIP domain-containing protein n=2 Tax=Psilocybe cubensis TaxID=181762 RepID=A0A8H8CHD4_PSICU|nr:hypothetical protein JR316_0007425 [Psilocybe cubensis]KAH9480824.1 hypothetical protein JR316_0007425 [Psilocybe cubensis]